ncbi:DUF202 domain-containing protein [Nocardia puris]|uniref:Uncharacterized protein DUF202 n=1 Tax=Nocardia puris TaxID=208602 RepID=A0A366E2V4_9NOCA|nr:DUF202 domain-containing protein [Nocardia puris]MBF6216277.1 DUF202 domain-containing protein [Nocardia puris]MBF6368930.1 DUF202 domain-containing protein [Nocardia puris]MBF6462922.1 DUF202 domain-containing protein [Nocardia puris]RBO96700.1 uncharacterized protein DUF202 [Nocardia puris]
MSIRDSTLVPERTALAWRRTALGAVVVAALFVAYALTSGWRGAALAPIAAALTLVAVAVAGMVRSHRLRTGHRDRANRVVAATTVAVLFAGGVATYVGAVQPPG